MIFLNLSPKLNRNNILRLLTGSFIYRNYKYLVIWMAKEENFYLIKTFFKINYKTKNQLIMKNLLRITAIAAVSFFCFV
jgi:hypothetical protein